MTNQELVFVVVTGSMRSGTSLIGHLLQHGRRGDRAHRDLAFDNDTSRFVVDLFEAVRLETNPVALYGDPFREVRLTKEMLERFYGCPVANFAAGVDKLRADLRSEIERLAPAGGEPKFIGLKRTSMNYEIAIIRELFPKLRSIFTVRDPRDTFISHAKRVQSDQAAGYSLLILSYILGNYYAIARHLKSDVATHVIKYEDFVARPTAYTTKLLEFIGMDSTVYDWDYLTGSGFPSNSSYNKGKGIEFVGGHGISGESVGRFQSMVSPDIVAFIELLCDPILRQYGYREAATSVDWEPTFNDFVTTVRDGCRESNVSFAPIAHRLKELGQGDCPVP